MILHYEKFVLGLVLIVIAQPEIPAGFVLEQQQRLDSSVQLLPVVQAYKSYSARGAAPSQKFLGKDNDLDEQLFRQTIRITDNYPTT